MKKNKYRRWWYGNVLGMIRNSHFCEGENSEMAIRIRTAMDNAVAETKNKPDGAERWKVINDICYHRCSIEQTAQKRHYSRWTVQRWWNDYVYSVGKYMGF